MKPEQQVAIYGDDPRLRVLLHELPSGNQVLGPHEEGSFTKQEALEAIEALEHMELTATGFWSQP